MSTLEEFKKFAMKGNMVELAIGVIIGTAFSGLINSIVNDVFMPVLGVFTGGLDFSNIYWQMVGSPQPTLDAARKAGATLAYGHFITVLINFLIISFVLFIVIKGLNKLQLAKSVPGSEEKPKTPTEIMLADIRDILRSEQTPAQAKAEAEARAKAAAKAQAEAEEAAGSAAAPAPLAALGALRKLKEAAGRTAAAIHIEPQAAAAKAEGESEGRNAAPAPAKPAAPAKTAARAEAAPKGAEAKTEAKAKTRRRRASPRAPRKSKNSA